MTEAAIPEQGFDVSLLDPTTWKEPVEVIPVICRVSKLRWSDAKYNAATEFRPALPRPIQQWDFQLERLDAKYALLDGTEAPVTIYAGVDLEKLVKHKDGSSELRTVMKGRGKEQLVITSWTKGAGSLVPDPSRLEGIMFEINFYRQKELAPGFFAKNVALFVKTLLPTFVFNGEVQVFKQSARADGTGIDDTEVATASAMNGASIDPAEAAALIAAFIRDNGITALDTTALGHPAFPEGCRIDPFVTAFANETVAETLASFGEEV